MPTVCIVRLPLFSVHTVGFDAEAAPLPDASPTIISVDRLLGVLLVACTEPQAAQAPQAAGCQPRAGPSFWAMSVRICT
jgi:hypothetical protein